MSWGRPVVGASWRPSAPAENGLISKGFQPCAVVFFSPARVFALSGQGSLRWAPGPLLAFSKGEKPMCLLPHPILFLCRDLAAVASGRRGFCGRMGCELPTFLPDGEDPLPLPLSAGRYFPNTPDSCRSAAHERLLVQVRQVEPTSSFFVSIFLFFFLNGFQINHTIRRKAKKKKEENTKYSPPFV